MNNYIVIESCSNIRMLARQALKGNWKPAILAILIFYVALLGPSILLELIFGDLSAEALMESTEVFTAGGFASSTYSILVTGAFSFGLCAFFLDLVRGMKKDVGVIFSGFNFYFKTLGLAIVTSIFIALWTLLFIVPGVIAAIRYSQAFYILADDPNKGIMQCIRESKQLMKGNKGKFFGLQLSFIGWYLLLYLVIIIVSGGAAAISIAFPNMSTTAFLVIMIVAMFVILMVAISVLMPYVQTATTIFYEMVTGNLRKEEEAPVIHISDLDNKVDDNINSVNIEE